MWRVYGTLLRTCPYIEQSTERPVDIHASTAFPNKRGAVHYSFIDIVDFISLEELHRITEARLMAWFSYDIVTNPLLLLSI